VFAVHMPIIALALVPTLLHWPVLLMPVHIVLLELLIDPACSIVFEMEPESGDIMTRPPRAPSQSPFARANLTHAVIQGLGFAGILLVAYGLMLNQGMDATQSRTAVYMALVLGVFVLILANRHLSHSLLADSITGNPWLLRMLVGVVAMLVAMVAVPFLRHVMGLAIPSAATLALCALLLAVSMVWLEGLRRTVRYVQKRAAQRDAVA